MLIVHAAAHSTSDSVLLGGRLVPYGFKGRLHRSLWRGWRTSKGESVPFSQADSAKANGRPDQTRPVAKRLFYSFGG